MRADLDLTNFTAGELSPRLYGRPDLAKYANGCESLFNMVVQPQGGATRRPGTMYVAPVGNQAQKPLLRPFIFSTLQAFVLEFGELYCRFYTNDGQILSGGVPVQIATPYHAADLPALNTVQSADTLFICQPSYPTQTLTRASDTSWSIFQPTFIDGPYLPVNDTGTALTLSACAHEGQIITLTASSIAGINDGAGFQPSDLGRYVRVKLQWLWSWLVITAVTSTTVVSAEVQVAARNGAQSGIDGQAWQPSTVYAVGQVVLNGSTYYQCVVAGVSAASGGPTGTGAAIYDNSITWTSGPVAPSLATLDWALGKWSATTGYPYMPTFWQNRLVLAGTNNEPNAIEISVTGDFYNFAPTQADGTVTDINAMSWVISDDQVNAVRWLSPAGSAQAMQLGIGTTGGEQILQASATSQALTPLNVQAYRETSFGSAPNLRALRIAKSVLFADRPGQKVHEWTFQWMVNGYVGPDLALLAEHITRSGITAWDYQQDPNGVVWAITAPGNLVGMTYLRDQDIVAWHRHQLGGQLYGGPPLVESLCCIPSPDGSYDELWLAVLRSVDGVLTRTVEVMTRYFEGMPGEQAWFLDCAVRSVPTAPAGGAAVYGAFAPPALDAGPTLAAPPATMESTSPVMTGTEGYVLRIAGSKALIQTVLSPTSATILPLAPFTSGAAVANGDWSLTAPFTSVGGVGYLGGETLGLFADGQDLGTVKTTSGQTSVALPAAATLALAGLPYASMVVTMPIDPGRAGGIGQGRIKRIDTLYLRLLESAGGIVGVRTVDPMTNAVTDWNSPIPARQAAAPMDVSAPLFTGILRLKPMGGADMEQRITAAQTAALPLTVTGIGARCDLAEVSPG